MKGWNILKYRAFIDFIHNGVRIKGGEVFDNDLVNFSLADINFLKEQSKIELVQTSIKPEIIVDNVKKDEIELKNKLVEPENTIVLAEESELEEDVQYELTPIEEEAMLGEIKEKEEIKSKIKDLDLTKLNKSKLVDLAIELNIDVDNKTKKELIDEILKSIE